METSRNTIYFRQKLSLDFSVALLTVCQHFPGPQELSCFLIDTHVGNL